MGCKLLTAVYITINYLTCRGEKEKRLRSVVSIIKNPLLKALFFLKLIIVWAIPIFGVVRCLRPEMKQPESAECCFTEHCN